MSAACALAEAGLRVQLVERRGYLGGRASPISIPASTKSSTTASTCSSAAAPISLGFYSRIGVADRIHWTSEMTMIEPGGRRSTLGPSIACPLRCTACRACSPRSAFTLADKLSLARAFQRNARGPIAGRPRRNACRLAAPHRQTQGALDRFWRLVIASALNAEIDHIAVPYAAKVIRELFMNSADAGGMGMSHRAAQRALCGQCRSSCSSAAASSCSTQISKRIRAYWDEETLAMDRLNTRAADHR